MGLEPEHDAVRFGDAGRFPQTLDEIFRDIPPGQPADAPDHYADDIRLECSESADALLHELHPFVNVSRSRIYRLTR